MNPKYLPLVGGLLLLALTCTPAQAADGTDAIRVPVKATSVWITTNTWAKWPTSPDANATLIHFANPATNTGTMIVLISSQPTTPVESTGSWAHEFQPGEGDYFADGPGVYFYGFSLHTASEPAKVQEYKQ